LFLTACAKAPALPEFVLGTVCSVNLYEYGTKKLYAKIFARIRQIDRTMSARADFQNITDLMKINQNAGIAPVKIPADLFEVLEQAKHYAQISDGAFDPTVGPLVNLWGIGTEHERIPLPGEITEALSLIDWRDLILDRRERTAYLARQGMALDLGAIAKGYAADEAARLARAARVRRAIIDLGGNIMVLGERGQGAPWRIGIQDPLDKRDAYIGVLLISDKSIVTSGVYERYFESGGRRYHHILSTKNGYPADNGLLSVTIIADSSIAADSLSTTVFALGYEQGMALLKTIPDAEAIFIFDDQTVVVTGGLRNIFTLVSDRYMFFFFFC
jgi:thiamine biosynthesis lipoprotein